MAERFRLPNGLTVVVHPSAAAQVAAFQIWVKVGGADERDGEVGLAHLHEHLLFKGTDTLGPGEVARAIEARGGEINAWTSHDQTVYHCVTASRDAEAALGVLADAVQHPRFDPDELAKEIEVVCEEIKRSEDSPGRQASRALFSAAFPHHPYGRAVLGDAASVRSHTREKVLRFFKHHYRPSNMVLAAAGDVTAAQVKGWAETLFGPSEPMPKGPESRAFGPPPARARVSVKTAAVKEAHVQLAFPAPSLEHADLAALDLLAMIAGQGAASHLSLHVRQQGLANEASTWAWTPKDPGLFAASLVAPPAKALAALEATAQVLWAFREQLVDPAELATAQANLEAEAVYGRESAQGLARRLGFYEAAMGGLEREAAYLEAAAQVTPESLREVARRTVRPEQALVSALAPEGTFAEGALEAALHSGVPVTLRRSEVIPRPPAGATVRRKAARPVVQVTLPSGAQVVVREERAVPLVAMRAAWLGGLRFEPPELNGLNALLARTFTRGTAHRSPEALSRLLDSLSGSISAVAGRSSFNVRAELLSKHFHAGFDAFSEVLRAPGFLEREVLRERERLCDDVRSRDDRPSALAFELLAQGLYQVHPYRLPMLGELETLARLTPQVLAEYHRRWLGPQGLVLAVVGDVDADEVVKRATEAFGAKVERPPLPVVPQEPPLSSRRELKRTLAKAQTHLALGFHGARVTDPDRRALEVLSTVLTGQSGRLFRVLRDQQSLAYSVSAMSVEGFDRGYFAVSMGTSPEKVQVALAGLEGQLERVRDERVGDDELARAKAYLVGSHAIGLQRNGARAASMALDAVYGLGATAYERYAGEIDAVTAEAVRTVAQRVIDFERSALAVVGA